MKIEKLIMMTALSLTGVGLSLSASAHDEDRLRWNLPDAPMVTPASVSYDYQPETRAYAEDYLVTRAGYGFSQVKNADRTYIGFLPGSFNVTDQEKDRLKHLLSVARKGDHVMVTGYTGNENKQESKRGGDGLELAKARAKTVVALLREINPGISIKSGATTSWSGDQDSARRVEVFLMKAVH